MIYIQKDNLELAIICDDKNSGEGPENKSGNESESHKGKKEGSMYYWQMDSDDKYGIEMTTKKNSPSPKQLLLNVY